MQKIDDVVDLVVYEFVSNKRLEGNYWSESRGTSTLITVQWHIDDFLRNANLDVLFPAPDLEGTAEQVVGEGPDADSSLRDFKIKKIAAEKKCLQRGPGFEFTSTQDGPQQIEIEKRVITSETFECARKQDPRSVVSGASAAIATSVGR